MATFLLFVKKYWKYILTVVLTLLALWLLAPSFERIASFFGYETRQELKDQRDQAVRNTEVAVDANKEQARTIKVLEDTAVNIQTTLTEVNRKKITRLKTFQAVQIKKIDRIAIVVNEDISEEEKDKKISQIQIESIWEVYCEYNHDTECKNNLPSFEPTSTNGPLH